MGCDESNLLCLTWQWLHENEFAASAFAAFIGENWQKTGGGIGLIATVLDKYGQLIVGIAGGSFGFWRWWRFRETILHKRLSEYLNEEDGRLKDANLAVLQSINRPGPSQNFSVPIIAPRELRWVLRERGLSFAEAAPATRDATRSLEQAREIIRRRIDAAERALRTHKAQLASTHLLQGAIVAAVAPNVADSGRRRERDGVALSHFQSALAVPECYAKLEALELEAHQHRKLGQWQNAQLAYGYYYQMADKLDDPRQQLVVRARAKRYLAEIEQILRILHCRAIGKASAGSRKAHALMFVSDGKYNEGPSVLDLRKELATCHGWDLLDQADCHYLAALIAHHMHFPPTSSAQLEEARRAYNVLIDELPYKMTNDKPHERRLRDLAQKGIKRVEAASAGTFDQEWLVPDGLTSTAAPNLIRRRRRWRAVHEGNSV
ncbi:MAG: hypothetical protein NW217_02980 [Hyphomicrobiaceae bacterium]|nr:hypothetical protein [Hyphomicrobiaceae bacterium]